ncbi:MAG: S9 family peptidase [Methanobacteriota archaeon]|nr:MAG: S9 family peptidase [Euryarchaeota archaeon]
MGRKVTFTPERFLKKIWQLGSFDVSPDGRRLAYSANKGEQWSVFVLDIRTKREKPLLRSDQSILQPEFSPDGQWLAVQSDFEGDENFNIYVTPAAGGAARKITDTTWDSASPRWSPDGRRIAFTSNRDGDRDNVFVVEATGGDTKQLTNVDDIVTEIAWRPDGKSIAFSAGVGLHDYVGLVDLAGLTKKVVEFPDSESSIGGDLGAPKPWSPDGRELAFVSNVHDHQDIGVLDIRTRRVRWLVESKWDKTRPLWSPGGKAIAFLENRDGNIQLKTVSNAGRSPRGISRPKGTASHALWQPNGRGLFFLYSTFTTPDRLVAASGKSGRVLVDSLRGKLPTGEFADGKLVRYRTFDGRRIPAWLFVPPKKRSRHAALVSPHGGPEAQTVNEWIIKYQFLVAQGFTVLAPNYRGGTGYGRAWRRLSDHDLGGADMQDIIAGGRWLVKEGHCAPDRLGAIGTSYGGYSVAHVLEKAPDLWAVGVSIVGYFNWMTATTNERGYLQRYDRQKMGHPDTDADRFRKYSPIYFLDSIRAPVLFTGGAHDPRCPVTEARAMVEEMRKMGKTVDYLEFPDEGHSPRKMSNQIRLHERAIGWLTRYLPEL